MGAVLKPVVAPVHALAPAPVTVTVTESIQTMSSREIARLTGSTHDNVLKTIRSLVNKGVVSENDTPYVHPQNGQTYREFRLNYRDTLVVVSGYSVELRARIIDRWQELEAQAAASRFHIPQTLPEALRLAADLADQNKVLEGTVAQQEPKVRGLDRIATSEGSLCVRDAAKVLQMRPIDLTQHLQSHRWIYKQGSDGWRAYQSKIGVGLLEQKGVTLWHSSVGRVRTQIRITPKGLVRLSEAFEIKA